MDLVRRTFAGLKDRYFKLDLNGDGVITLLEFRQFLERMVGEPCPDDEWAPFEQIVDGNKSGTLEFDEFLLALSLWFADDGEDDVVDEAFGLLKGTFKKLDTDHDGTLVLLQVQRAIEILESLNAPATTPRSVDPQTAAHIFLRLGIPSGNPVSFKQFLVLVYSYTQK